MTTKEIRERVLNIIQDLTALYAELDENFLRVIADNTREFSELKKIPERCLCFRG